MMQAVQKQLLPAYIRQINLVQSINKHKYYWITRPLFVILIARLIVFFSGYLTEIAIPGIVGNGLYHASPNNVFPDIWARWDTGFYLRIAEMATDFRSVSKAAWYFPGIYNVGALGTAAVAGPRPGDWV